MDVDDEDDVDMEVQSEDDTFIAASPRYARASMAHAAVSSMIHFTDEELEEILRRTQPVDGFQGDDLETFLMAQVRVLCYLLLS